MNGSMNCGRVTTDKLALHSTITLDYIVILSKKTKGLTCIGVGSKLGVGGYSLQ